MELNNIRLGISHEPGTFTIAQGKMEWTSTRNRDKKITVVPDAVKTLEWTGINKSQHMLKVLYKDKSKPGSRFIGFPNRRQSEVAQICESVFGKSITAKPVNTHGCNWGQFVLRSQELVARTEQKETLFSIPYSSIGQTVIQAKNELSIEFKHPSSARNDHDTLHEMRIYIPDDADGTDESPHQQFHRLLLHKANLELDSTTMIANFGNIVFRLPRGRYKVQFYPEYFTIRSETFSYNIEYPQIKRLFILEQPNNTTSLLVKLQPPIRQGQTTYGFVIMEFPNDEQCSSDINATEKEMSELYTDKNGNRLLSKKMEGPTYDVLSRVFMALSKVKIIASTGFESKNQFRCIDCSVGANKGLLYPLERSFFFIHKPCLYFRHTDIASLEFLRIQEKSRMFDLKCEMRKDGSEVSFTNIDKSEYNPLVKYVLEHDRINVVNRDFHVRQMNASTSLTSRSSRTRTRITQAVTAIADIPDDDDDDEEDEDFVADEDEIAAADRQDEKDFDRNVDDRVTEKMDVDENDDLVGDDYDDEDGDVQMKD